MWSEKQQQQHHPNLIWPNLVWLFPLLPWLVDEWMFTLISFASHFLDQRSVFCWNLIMQAQCLCVPITTMKKLYARCLNGLDCAGVYVVSFHLLNWYSKVDIKFNDNQRKVGQGNVVLLICLVSFERWTID